MTELLNNPTYICNYTTRTEHGLGGWLLSGPSSGYKTRTETPLSPLLLPLTLPLPLSLTKLNFARTHRLAPKLSHVAPPESA